MSKPSFRKLRGYAFDPSFSSTISRRQSNEVTYKIRWEDTKPGPVGEYIEVVDYDPTKECFYEAIDLQHSYVLADHGFDPSEGDPRFHQQQVYAVCMSVIAQFEKALGRKIIWSRLVRQDNQLFDHQFVERLRIYPHALRQQNAFYSPDKIALLFGYFQASGQWSGNNVPGAAVFTCLSPDIVAHEMTHAILDSIHPYWRRGTNPDMLAFHEGFSDIIALLQRFTFTPVVKEQIRNSRGDLLSPENLLGDLAIQFGQAVSGNRRALRSFLVENDENGKPRMVKPDPSKYHTITEPHGRGALLVAAVFDAFTRLYRFKVADLIRLASNGTGILSEGAIPSDLVNRLSEEACEIANKLMLVCIRALDYCPLVDLTFGDYLRALVTADVDYNADDEDGLRFALLESFRSWGIIPDDVNNYSVQGLKWKSLEECFDDKERIAALQTAIQFVFNPDKASVSNYAQRKMSSINEVTGSMDKILRLNQRREIFEESNKLCARVHSIFDRKLQYYRENMEELLGMSFQDIKYSFFDETLGHVVDLKANSRELFQVYQCRPVIRHNNRDGITNKLLIITFIQKAWVGLAGSDFEDYLKDDKYGIRGGATLIIDLANYKIKYAILKNITSSHRLKQQLHYTINNMPDGDNNALLMQTDEPFAALHLH